jgi:hypothetical protein
MIRAHLRSSLPFVLHPVLVPGMPARASTIARLDAAYGVAFTSTITDEGPDVSAQPNKLWTDRNSFQATRPVFTPTSPSDAIATLEATQQVFSTCMAQPAPAWPSHAHADDLPAAEPSTVSADDPPASRTDSETLRADIKKQEESARRLNVTCAELEQLVQAQPELEAYYGLKHRLGAVLEGINNLNRKHIRVQNEVKPLRARHAKICMALDKWRKVITFPTQPRTADTSKLHYILLLSAAAHITVAHHFDYIINQYSVLEQLCFLFAVICYIILGVSRKDGGFILGMLNIILNFVLSQLDTAAQLHRNPLPKTLDTVLKKFALDGKITVYAVCPACHANYLPSLDPNGALAYPTQCTNWPTPESVCGAALLDAKGEARKTYTMHAFDDYLAGLFSRHRTEEFISRSWNSTMGPSPSSAHTPFDAEFLRTFQGPDGQTLFADVPDGEARLAFTLCIDFFATEGMKIRGPHTSVGIIAMACLNLPIDIRYKPENMYLVGIVPGEKEPSLTQLNHYIELIVTDLLEAWSTGIRLSRTAMFPAGRLIRAALAAVVCDLPAARQTSALASYNAMIFCSRCDCWDRRGKNGKIIKGWKALRGRSDHECWKRRSRDQMHQAAIAWRDARSTHERNVLFSKNGVRWSPLWKLPYWDPTRQLVVDSMHCLLEGVAHFHFTELLELTDAGANAKPKLPPAFQWDFSEPSLEDDSPSADAAASEDSDDNDDHPPNQAPSAPVQTELDSKHLPALRRTHRALTAQLLEDGEEKSRDTGDMRTTKQLQSYLQRLAAPILVYIVDDLELSVNISGRRSKPIKADYVSSIMAWVCHFMLLVSLL